MIYERTDVRLTSSFQSFSLSVLKFSTCANPITRLFCPPKNLHMHCFRFLLGHLHVSGEIANNDYAKFWWLKQVYYGICARRQLTHPQPSFLQEIIPLPRDKPDFPKQSKPQHLNLRGRDHILNISNIDLKHW